MARCEGSKYAQQLMQVAGKPVMRVSALAYNATLERYPSSRSTTEVIGHAFCNDVIELHDIIRGASSGSRPLIWVIQFGEPNQVLHVHVPIWVVSG